jgi:hypothetical protein
MKRLSTLLLLICTSVFVLNAQSFEVYDHQDDLVNGETIIIPTTVNGPEVYFYFTVKNVSGIRDTVKILQTLQTTQIADSYHSICSPNTELSTGQCGMPWGSTSATFVLNAGETSEDGDFRFTQGPNPGVTTILYKVYNVNNESDFISFTVTFSTLTVVNFNTFNDFSVYPNPAVNTFTITNEYGPSSYVEIYNILGMQVNRLDFSDSGETLIDCSGWEKGYYFCRLYNDGKIEKTIKLTVTH